jgi:hypothetical protein
MRQDVAWHRGTGFLIEPPVVIEDEGTVSEHQDMLVFLLGFIRRKPVWIRVGNAGDVHQLRDGRLPGRRFMDHVASVRPTDSYDRRPSTRNGAAHLGRVDGQPGGCCSMRR